MHFAREGRQFGRAIGQDAGVSLADPLPYSLPDYSDVAEPTEEELAEIDFELFNTDPSSPPEPCTVSAWYRSEPVRAALAAAGDHDGSSEWMATFTEHLLGYVDSMEAAAPRRLVELVELWDYTYAKWDGELRRCEPDIPREILAARFDGHQISFTNCAWLLRITVEQLEQIMFGKHTDTIREAAREWSADRSQTRLSVAERWGVPIKGFRQYLQLVLNVAPAYGQRALVPA